MSKLLLNSPSLGERVVPYPDARCVQYVMTASRELEQFDDGIMDATAEVVALTAVAFAAVVLK